MSFTYTTGLPNPPDNPSVDVSSMQTNCNSINSWVQTDHIGFNTGSGGQHKQVTYNNTLGSAPGASGSLSVGFTLAGTASSAPQLFFQNANATVHISPIRAWGFMANGATTPAAQSFNVSSTSQSSNNWTVNLVSGAETGGSFVVLASALSPIVGSPGHNAGVTVISTGSNTFTVATYDAVTGASGVASGIYFIVMQI